MLVGLVDGNNEEVKEVDIGEKKCRNVNCLDHKTILFIITAFKDKLNSGHKIEMTHNFCTLLLLH